jgi:hypothetical protein
MSANEQARIPALSWQRSLVLLLIGLTLGVAVVFGVSVVSRASEHYAEALSTALPQPHHR